MNVIVDPLAECGPGEQAGGSQPFAQASVQATPKQAEEALLDAKALQDAIFNCPNFSSIATDAKDVIRIFSVGAERMLGYTAADVAGRITPADTHDRQELIARTEDLSAEFTREIKPGFQALVFKVVRGIQDIYELTKVREDGSRFPAEVFARNFLIAAAASETGEPHVRGA